MYSASASVKLVVDHDKEETKIEEINGSINSYSDPSLSSELKRAYNEDRDPSYTIPEEEDGILLYNILLGLFRKIRKRRYKNIY